jgi:glycosyltransferase involved in cell wall biosynthesis/uncharacterized SAM-binding protein YcdF (DUF218 family)
MKNRIDEGISNRNIIIFSSIDWSAQWQIHHHLAKSFTDSGNRVLFVENTGVRTLRLNDFDRILSRIKNRAKSTHGFSEADENLYIYSPGFLPFPYSKIANLINSFFIVRALRKYMFLLKFSNPIVISFLPTPIILKIVKLINPELVIYYCADEMSRPLKNPEKLNKSENKFFTLSDVVLTTSKSLYNKAKKYSNSIYMLPAGVDINKFNPHSIQVSTPKDVSSITTPIVGYIGAISNVFDKELIVKLAKSMPNIAILLVGPIKTDISIFKACNNIITIGSRDHECMPSYVNLFDVALIPYIVNNITNSVYPCKLNEYLAMGKPVVSTGILEVKIFIEEYPGSLIIADGDDFIVQVKSILNGTESKLNSFDKRVDVANINSWCGRYIRLQNIIVRELDYKYNKYQAIDESISKKFEKSKKLFQKITATLLLLFFIIFISPLFWAMGNWLVVDSDLVSSDAVVIFSGDGESSYINSSYQQRALDAISLYKSGYVDKVYISSGRKQTIPEVSIIRLLLEKNGVDSNNINILEEYPNSTYQNISLVGRSLIESKIDSIIFLTSAYHSRRSLLLWNKNFPNIDVHAVRPSDAPNKSMQWGVSADKIKVILYEYAAIIFNWMKGWL